MSKQTLKSIARRGSMLTAAFAVVAASLVQAVPAYADALNPLTDRSLTLSSSAPGWDFKDGSGNSTYAPPNSGANGQKVANYYDFKVTTDTATSNTLKAMSFQYCTSPAGSCLAPGDNGWLDATTRNADTASKSDLNVTVASPSQATIAADTPTDYVTMSNTTVSTNPNGDFTSVPCTNDSTPGVVGYQTGDCSAVAGKNFAVYYDNAGTWTESTGWSMSAANFEINGSTKTSGAVQNQATGKNNEIRLVHSTTTGFAAGTRVRVVFFATDTNYITNPGSGAFFVRINTYNTGGNTAINSMSRYDEANVIDGGVTVANVMNLGIQITTKVLETMAFSVGTVDPYTLEASTWDDDSDGGLTPEVPDPTSQLGVARGASPYTHGVCEPVLRSMVNNVGVPNRLSMGNPTAEYSLEVDKTYSTHSYFRLSSNSSAGATIYYSGNTLTNTVGDSIDAIGAAATAPAPGNEQFGLGLSINNTNPYGIDYRTETKAGYVYETAADDTAAGLTTYPTQGIHSSVEDDAISNVDANGSWHTPRLASLTPAAAYANGAGYVNAIYNNNAATDNQFNTDGTSFAFVAGSTLIPVPLASDSANVVDCVTGKVRYIANIAATTPAGIYTTKINYIAAPQY